MRYLIVLLVAACATRPDVRWHRPGASQEQLSMESADCQSRAFAVPQSGQERIQIVYLTCMESKGWRLVER